MSRTKSKKSNRDGFSAKTRDLIAKRVAYRCCYKGCGIATIGPKYGDKLDTTSIGVACHICAASPKGPRYDASMTSEQRRSAENGIWMCETHSHLIDKDVAKFPVDLLRDWKLEAEDAASKALANYNFSKDRLKDTVYISALCNKFIKDGFYDALLMIIEQLKLSDYENEFILRYKVIYNAYCNRDELYLSIEYYLEHATEKKCDEILKTLVSLNISIGIERILPYCLNTKVKSWATAIINGTIKSKLIVNADIEHESYNINDWDTARKLLSAIIVESGIPQLPLMEDGNKFKLVDDEFLFQLWAHCWNLHNLLNNNKPFNNKISDCEDYQIIKYSISKVKQLDKSIQKDIWSISLRFVLSDENEFDCLYSQCPEYIKNDKDIKRIYLNYQLNYNKVKAEDILFDDSIKEDDDSLLFVLERLNRDDRAEFLEEHKYLLKKNSAFLYLWIDELDAPADEKYQKVKAYSDIYKDDFLWNCLLALFSPKGDQDIINWLEKDFNIYHFYDMPVYLKALKKYNLWDRIKYLIELSFPDELKYQILLVLCDYNEIENNKFCLTVFCALANAGFRRKGFYYNYAIIYNRLNELRKAMACFQKEYDLYQDNTSLINLLISRINSNDFTIDSYVEDAAKADSSQAQFFVAMINGALNNTYSAKMHLIRALLIDPNNKEALERLPFYMLESVDKNDLGKVYTLQDICDESRVIKVALLKDELVSGITCKSIFNIIPQNASSTEFSSWKFSVINEDVKYKNKKFKITSIEEFDSILGKEAFKYAECIGAIKTIRGNSPEDSILKMNEIVEEQQKSSLAVFDNFNQQRGILPIKILCDLLGKDFYDVWGHIITKNSLKINNFSNTTNNKSYLLSVDALCTFICFDALGDLNLPSMVCEIQTKNHLINIFKQKLRYLQQDNAVGELYFINGKMQCANYDRQYKKDASEYFTKSIKQIDEIKTISANGDQFNDKEFEEFFIKNGLYIESKILEFARSNKEYVVVADEPFICLMCEREHIQHISAIDLLFNQELSIDDILKYLQRLDQTNFLNYFNANLLKKMLDYLYDEEKLSIEDLKEKIKQWLLPKEHSKEHAIRVYNACREIVVSEPHSKYANSALKIASCYFAELFPDKYKAMIDNLANSIFSIRYEPETNGDLSVQIHVDGKDKGDKD